MSSRYTEEARWDSFLQASTPAWCQWVTVSRVCVQPSGLSLSRDGGELFVADSESSTVRGCELTTGGGRPHVGGDRLFTDNLFRFGDRRGPLIPALGSPRQCVWATLSRAWSEKRCGCRAVDHAACWPKTGLVGHHRKWVHVMPLHSVPEETAS